jgi:hypothetical protein
MLLRGHSHNLGERINRLLVSVMFAVLPLLAVALIGYVLKAGFGNNLKPVEAAAGINKMVSYQAKMTDSIGVTVENGTYYLTLRIYDSASGGTCLYSAVGTCGTPTSTAVTVTNGVLSVMIGDVAGGQNALNLDFNSDTYYLGVQINNDSEMTPRKRIGAAGYAFNSDTLDGYETSLTGGSGSYVPVTTAGGDLFITNRIFSSSTIYLSGAGTSTLSAGALLATAGGNVGVGTSSPAYKLDVNGDINFYGNLFQNGLPFAGSQWGTSGNDIYYTIGNVGIGTTAPSERLTVGGNGAFGGGSSTSTIGKDTLIIGATTGYNLGKFYVDSLGNISASGTLGITGPASFASLTVSGTSTFTGGFFFTLLHPLPAVCRWPGR